MDFREWAKQYPGEAARALGCSIGDVERVVENLESKKEAGEPDVPGYVTARYVCAMLHQVEPAKKLATHEYIERCVAMNAVGSIDTSKPWDNKDDIVEKAIAVIDHIPIADVAPVVHARWIIPDEHYPDTCSNCLFEFVWDGDKDYHPKWCPNCGAKMDKDS